MHPFTATKFQQLIYSQRNHHNSILWSLKIWMTSIKLFRYVCIRLLSLYYVRAILRKMNDTNFIENGH